MEERCELCGCVLSRTRGSYATETINGRSAASKHHFVAERYFGRSGNRRGTQRSRILDTCPWDLERQVGVFCYECHEILLHNPIFLPEDVKALASLMRQRRLSEDRKTGSCRKMAGRVMLLHEVIAAGLRTLEKPASRKRAKRRIRHA